MLDEKNRSKLAELKNEHVVKIIEEYIALCKPDKVTVLTDSPEDIQYVRDLAIANGEEKKLNTEGHTIHYDNYFDQARDKANTRVMLPKGKKLGKHIKTIDYDDALKEAMEQLDDIMKGKEMLVCFYSLGPNNSKFSIPSLQMTDSAYVAHNENLLYRQGYQEFKRLNGSKDFFHFIHSAGVLDEKNTTKNIDKRRIYMDLEEERVFSINNQYGGNSIGLKKLALRLAISKAHKEDWLSEHMFIVGIHPEGKDRVSYFTGAYPSLCGKTSTAMIPGQSIVGDDIAYLKIDDEGYIRAANVEQGIFGVIQDVSPKDDPLLYETLTSPRELVISNVLVVDGNTYWLGMGKELPKEGFNHAGEWKEGMLGPDDKVVDVSNKNARFTLRIDELKNADPLADDPDGVPISGIIYGGRDSNTSVPVLQSLSWAHGVFIGAALESETTAATIGAEGQLKHSAMANMDFLVVPLSVYIKNHIKFGNDADKTPMIFSTNYFLKDGDRFLNEKVDKKVWLLWMEGRVHGDYEAIETPVGFIPKHEDLNDLFKQAFDREYSKVDYDTQFSIRIKRLLDKLDRIEEIYKDEEDMPPEYHQHLEQQRKRLKDAQDKFGKDVVLPGEFV